MKKILFIGNLFLYLIIYLRIHYIFLELLYWKNPDELYSDNSRQYLMKIKQALVLFQLDCFQRSISHKYFWSCLVLLSGTSHVTQVSWIQPFHVLMRLEPAVFHKLWRRSRNLPIIVVQITTQKNSVFHEGFLQQIWTNPQEFADLIRFTEEILNKIILFLCSECKGHYFITDR